MTKPKYRVIVWYSCGAASAVVAKYANDKYPHNLEICYCDTSLHEHPDNLRFMADCEKWIGLPIKRLRSEKWPDMDIYKVFEKEKRMRNQKAGGAVCTDRLKRKVRISYQRPDDTHIFGYTADEPKRIERFEIANPALDVDWILSDAGITKSDCYRIIKEAGIALPAMYLLGYKNNNCIGCVKGGKGYWNKVRRDFPEVFKRQAELERKLNDRVLRDCFLDELKEGVGRYNTEPDIECGAMCVMPEDSK